MTIPKIWKDKNVPSHQPDNYWAKPKNPVRLSSSEQSLMFKNTRQTAQLKTLAQSFKKKTSDLQ